MWQRRECALGGKLAVPSHLEQQRLYPRFPMCRPHVHVSRSVRVGPVACPPRPSAARLAVSAAWSALRTRSQLHSLIAVPSNNCSVASKELVAERMFSANLAAASCSRAACSDLSSRSPISFLGKLCARARRASTHLGTREHTLRARPPGGSEQSTPDNYLSQNFYG